MTVTPVWSDTTFASMGSTARLLILGGPSDLSDWARERLEEIEGRWSRFQPDSELCRLNGADGAPVVVSSETFDVIALAIAAWRETSGRFDPTVLDALESAGYDRDFQQVDSPGEGVVPRPGATPGCGEIELDGLVSAVTLPRGVHLDLGGIGKGRAADLIAAELLEQGADGVCVNLGGDVRVEGVPPEAAGWQVDLDPALAPAIEAPWSFRLGAGAVATSTRLRRAWDRDGVAQHHIIDPATGRPAWSGLAAVTVLAETTAWAEMLAKSAFVAGPDVAAELLEAQRVTGLFVHDNGWVQELAGIEAFLDRPAPSTQGVDPSLPK